MGLGILNVVYVDHLILVSPTLRGKIAAWLVPLALQIYSIKLLVSRHFTYGNALGVGLRSVQMTERFGTEFPGHFRHHGKITQAPKFP